MTPWMRPGIVTLRMELGEEQNVLLHFRELAELLHQDPMGLGQRGSPIPFPQPIPVGGLDESTKHPLSRAASPASSLAPLMAGVYTV